MVRGPHRPGRVHWPPANPTDRPSCSRLDWKHAFVACHGVVNRTILAQALGAGPEIYRRIEQDPGCLNVLDIDGTGPKARVAYVRLMNFTPYNATKQGMQETTMETLWRQFLES